VQRWCVAAALFVGCCATAVIAQEVPPEYQLKAAFVAKFPEFTEWPAVALNSRKTIDICVARPNPFGDTLSHLVANETVRTRQLQVREIASPADVPSCLVLFIPAKSVPQQHELLVAAQKTPVLTVGESTTFFEEGGMINLRLVDGRVRFDVNVGAAERVGVRFSSQLLRLAVNVRGQQS
jgi:hypothetical protein